MPDLGTRSDTRMTPQPQPDGPPGFLAVVLTSNCARWEPDGTKMGTRIPWQPLGHEKAKGNPPVDASVLSKKDGVARMILQSSYGVCSTTNMVLQQRALKRARISKSMRDPAITLGNTYYGG